MSYINTDIFPELTNKKVLFFDLETTGLVKNVKKYLLLESQYPSYKTNKYYDSSRLQIISII